MLWSGNKKGYLRTLEAMFAVLLTFSVVAVIMGTPKPFSNFQDVEVLSELMHDENFRNNIINLTDSCQDKGSNTLLVNMTENFLENYNFTICNGVKPTLPLVDVHVDSAFITGNITNYLDNGQIRLFYWNLD